MRTAVALLLLLALPSRAQEARSLALLCGAFAIEVTAEGRVTHLTRIRGAAPAARDIPGPPAPIASWHALLDAARFESMARGEASSANCALTRRQGTSSFTHVWFGREPPEPLREVVRAMREAAGP